MESHAENRPMRPFLLLVGGQAVSLLGSQAVQFALIWWLTLETGSAAVLAAATFFTSLKIAAARPRSVAVGVCSMIFASFSADSASFFFWSIIE